MGPESMVAGGDSQAGHEVVDDGPNGGLKLQRCREGPVHAD